MNLFIRCGRDPVENRLQFNSFRFHLFIGGIGRHPHRRPAQVEALPERERQFEAIPTAEDFFFEQAKVTGTIGRPVALARRTTPAFAT